VVNLPPVQLLKVGTQYFVVDGHKRVAAARRTGAVVDAIVVELRPHAPHAASAAV
jgi:ParB-like chromosome segregation protein Spo0J